MSLAGVTSLNAGIVSTQPKKMPGYVLDERPKKDDTVDKFIKQKADDAKEVPVKERTAKNWIAIAADFAHKLLTKPTVLS